ncbi:MAG TPA: isoleucine--tRNA ligase [Acidimicrobiia bacterium]|nr:isoleucine--tRNA ligase [Acidimicrobiia bacterium]
MTRSDFQRVSAQVDFPALELEVLDLWDRIDAFTRSVSERPLDKEYVFYDGPPFANGSPHYGHLLASVVKDVVPRYWTMRGYRVERRWGWDTHGLPVEMEVQKQLGLAGPREIEEFGIDRFITACRELVEETADEWEFIVRRLGRWVDMENDYRTLDLTFMESVWWVFKQLWDQGRIYRSVKVLPYSWGATTPLANFEANLDYRDVEDPSITVRLRVTDPKGPVEGDDYLLIWTTTPWTLPANLAVAVGDDITYARVADNGAHYWVAESLVTTVFDEEALVVATAPGSDLVGVGYEPPFDYFLDQRDAGAFRVIPSVDVTTEEGTGLVHMAPAYGEADFESLRAVGLDVLVDPVDAQGNFTDAVPDVAGVNVKEADAVLIGLLRESGKLVKASTIVHSYPFCYRTGTPLIYKAIPTWFVEVSSMADRLVELNETIHWVPSYVGEGRFGNWLENARDWAISRNRYWGSCLPIWECEACEHRLCVGSIDELEELSGIRPDDLHMHVVDQITIPCPECGGKMERVPEVLDCWFESGSMPYGQIHYPFENKERFEAAFPAQFISEGLDQTRGWFYTLHVLATALFDQPAFQNCVVSGLILAEDGRKMSKSLRNYPDPEAVFAEFGADALRAYLLDSPVLRAEPIRFSNEGIRHVVRTVLLPLWNTHSFFTTYAVADQLTLDDLRQAPAPQDRPLLDRWILSVLQSLIATVNEQMEGYYLYNVIGPTLGFIDDLTNWYVRRSRRRFWTARGEDDADKLAAFATLYEVLTTFVRVLAPVLPFITERLYQDLVVEPGGDGPDSVHLASFPTADESLIDRDLEKAVSVVRRVVSAGHSLRKRHSLRVRQPLSRLTVITHDAAAAEAVRTHADLIADELNVRLVETSRDDAGLADLSAKADFRRLGPRLGADVKTCAAAIAAMGNEEIARLLDGETLEVAGYPITAEDVIVTRTPREGTVVETDGELAVALDTRLDDDLIAEGLARDVVNRIQQVRRAAGLDVADRIRLRWSTEDGRLRAAVERHRDYIAKETLATEMVQTDGLDGQPTEVDGVSLVVSVERV